MITSEEVREALRKACKEAGSQRNWALSNNLTPAYVNDVLQRKRDAGKAIVRALFGDGYKKTGGWVKENDN